MLSIREYVHQLDWDNICKIHDQARIIELENAMDEKVKNGLKISQKALNYINSDQVIYED